ncbi:MAG TPA: hypothetical protein VK789_07230 [Bryobacteraceae bacterium]|nr:hypothetical protein [Bryobacteraceae bacterium]
MPDFVCREMIHSRTEADPGGVIETQSLVEFLFTGRQKRASFGGGYSSVLVHIFGKKGRDNYSFTWGKTVNMVPKDPSRSTSRSRKSNLRVKESDGTRTFNGTGRP